jgi:hypothetical protein
MIITLAIHASVGEILENGDESAKPVYAEDHLIACQGNDKEIQNELLTNDAQFDVLANASAGDLDRSPQSPGDRARTGARGGGGKQCLARRRSGWSRNQPRQ